MEIQFGFVLASATASVCFGSLIYGFNEMINIVTHINCSSVYNCVFVDFIYLYTVYMAFESINQCYYHLHVYIKFSHSSI